MFLIRRDEAGDVVGDLLVLWEICWCCGRFIGVVGDLLVRKKKMQPVRPTPALQWTSTAAGAHPGLKQSKLQL